MSTKNRAAVGESEFFGGGGEAGNRGRATAIDKHLTTDQYALVVYSLSQRRVSGGSSMIFSLAPRNVL